MKSPFDYGAEKCRKQLRSRSPVRKRYKRSRSHSVKSPMPKNAVNYQVQDHQKGKDTTEVTHNVGKAHLTMVLKNAINNQDQDHQKEKCTREVTHNVGKVHLTIMVTNTVNNQDQDHQ